jgi:hypothetical protein
MPQQSIKWCNNTKYKITTVRLNKIRSFTNKDTLMIQKELNYNHTCTGKCKENSYGRFMPKCNSGEKALNTKMDINYETLKALYK